MLTTLSVGHRTIRRSNGRRSTVKLLTRDGARRIAANVVKLPELLPAPATHERLHFLKANGAIVVAIPPAEPVCKTCQENLPAAEDDVWLTYRRTLPRFKRAG